MSIVAQIQILLNDSGVFWPTATVLDAVNEAQFHIYADTKWAISTASLTLSSNADIVSIPATMLIPKWIEGTNTLYNPPVVKRFFVTSPRNLEHYLRTWRGAGTGQPGYFILWDATHLRCFPRPDSTYHFTLFGTGFPTEITNTTSDITGPATYVLAIQNYAAALLFEQTRPDLADLYMAQAQAQILAFKKRLRRNLSHNIRQLIPATGPFEINQGGQINEGPSYYPVEA
jgi:hypothetical protein